MAVTIAWDHTYNCLVGTFTRPQLGWLRPELTGFRDLLDWRFRQYVAEDPLAAHVGLLMPAKLTEDARLRAVLRTYLAESDPIEIRLLWEPDVLGGLRAAIERVLATLPDHGGRVMLPTAQLVHDWMNVLLDLRTAYAISAGVPQALDSQPRQPRTKEERQAYTLVWWLRDVVERIRQQLVLRDAP